MPRKKSTNEEILDTLNGLVEAVGNGFDKVNGKLSRIELTILAEHARRIEHLEHKAGIRN